jgi:hypothetical protein
LATYRTSSKWAVAALLQFMAGAPHVNGSAKGSFGVSVKVVLEGGVREITFDADVDELLRAALLTYRNDSKYYVIRETISVSRITYDFKGTGQLEASAKEAIRSLVKGSQVFSWTDNSRSTLSQKFDRPYRVFFTADELLAPGLGMGESGPTRIQPEEPIAWTNEVVEGRA